MHNCGQELSGPCKSQSWLSRSLASKYLTQMLHQGQIKSVPRSFDILSVDPELREDHEVQ